MKLGTGTPHTQHHYPNNNTTLVSSLFSFTVIVDCLHCVPLQKTTKARIGFQLWRALDGTTLAYSPHTHYPSLQVWAYTDYLGRCREGSKIDGKEKIISYVAL